MATWVRYPDDVVTDLDTGEKYSIAELQGLYYVAHQRNANMGRVLYSTTYDNRDDAVTALNALLDSLGIQPVISDYPDMDGDG